MKTKKIAARRIVFIKQCKVELLSALVREAKQIWVNKVTNLKTQVVILVVQNALKYTFLGSQNYSLTPEVAYLSDII